MHLSAFTHFLVAVFLAATLSSAKLVAKELYTKNIAFGQLAHINDYRTKHAGTLTAAQSAALDLIEDFVAHYSTGNLAAVESACVAAFGKEECYATITANHLRTGSSPGTARSLDARADNWCACATLSDYCKHVM